MVVPAEMTSAAQRVELAMSRVCAREAHRVSKVVLDWARAEVTSGASAKRPGDVLNLMMQVPC